ncbi:MAG: phosphopyruvate hydratase [Thermoprotei archaeon]|nr:MAG: phosphopyruvate hydratase [Thermoprotei archaeon]RLF17721.1 MAG: phosphopyruvate hydratase [Thermoprotei archaeon]
MISVSSEEYKITLVKGREVIDSRGNPTVEAEVRTKCGIGIALVPAGASKGVHEAVELRDGDKRFHGLGVRKAVDNINQIIAPAITGMDVRQQRSVDNLMITLDGTKNKSKLGANAILAVSLAVAKAAASSLNVELFEYLGGRRARTLPVPLMNILNGGKHAGNELSIQEFMIVPLGADKFSEALRIGCEVYHELKAYLKEKYGVSAINVGDEGGFAPPMKYTRDALDALMTAIKRAGYEPGSDVALAIDAAASSFYLEKEDSYFIDGKKIKRDELLEYYINLVSEYPIISIEDPFHEEDFESFSQITEKLKGKAQIVGDDLFVTNVERLKKGIAQGAANALLLKVNQIGTLSEAIDAAELAFSHGYNVIVSHRSGETEDTTIADLAVALNSGLIKTGAPARGERTAKYNRLLRIEDYLGEDAIFPGWNVFRRLGISRA